jgi:hypothetical protein
MLLGLDKVIRKITTSPKEEFFSHLKENLSERLHEKMSEKYILSLNEIFTKNKKEKNKQEIKVNESILEEKSIDCLIKNLKESYFNNNTIIHKFQDGNSVAITPDDSALLIKMHDNLNIMNQDRMRKLMSESFIEYNKILKFSKKHTERIS